MSGRPRAMDTLNRFLSVDCGQNLKWLLPSFLLNTAKKKRLWPRFQNQEIFGGFNQEFGGTTVDTLPVTIGLRTNSRNMIRSVLLEPHHWSDLNTLPWKRPGLGGRTIFQFFLGLPKNFYRFMTYLWSVILEKRSMAADYFLNLSP